MYWCLCVLYVTHTLHSSSCLDPPMNVVIQFLEASFRRVCRKVIIIIVISSIIVGSIMTVTMAGWYLDFLECHNLRRKDICESNIHPSIWRHEVEGWKDVSTQALPVYSLCHKLCVTVIFFQKCRNWLQCGSTLQHLALQSGNVNHKNHDTPSTCNAL